MGIDYSAKLVAGLPSGEMNKLRDEDGYYDPDGVIEFVPRCYDGDDGIVGVVVQTTRSYSYSIVDHQSVKEDSIAALDEFKMLTGQEGNLYLCVHGW